MNKVAFNSHLNTIVLYLLEVEVVILVYFIFLLFNSAAQANGCQMCDTRRNELNKEVQTENYYQNLLKKNQDYIAAAAQSNPSGVVKAKSNVFFINLKLEAIKNRITFVTNDLEQKGCAQCPPK